MRGRSELWGLSGFTCRCYTVKLNRTWVLIQIHHRLQEQGWLTLYLIICDLTGDKPACIAHSARKPWRLNTVNWNTAGDSIAFLFPWMSLSRRCMSPVFYTNRYQQCASCAKRCSSNPIALCSILVAAQTFLLLFNPFKEKKTDCCTLLLAKT